MNTYTYVDNDPLSYIDLDGLIKFPRMGKPPGMKPPPIGDWNQEVVLGVLVYSAKVFMLYQGNRHLEQADRLSAELLWRHIDRFTHSDDPEDLKIGLEGRYRPRFLIHDIADDSVASAYEVVVVERADGCQRLLWKSRGGDVIQEIDLPKLTVDTTISSFLRWAENLSSATQ
ncbi:MAG: hypothetical protein V4693_12650 [Pseudomonadota bacterium]